jgi:hypothetical protein
MQGTVYNSLSINQRYPTPLDLTLNSGARPPAILGISRLTKILLVSEKGHFPALAFRPTRPTSECFGGQGLGLDSTQFYGSLLAGKHFGN